MKVLQRVWQLPLHVFVVGAFPALFLYTQNQNELTPEVLVVPILVTWLASYTLLSVVLLVAKNWLRAALITTFIIALFFTYPHIYQVVGFGKVTLAGLVVTTSKLFNLLVLFTLVGGVVFLARYRGSLTAATKVLNMVAVTLMVVSISTLWGKPGVSARAERLANDASGMQTTQVGEETFPDIYYLIFDRYANGTSLSQYGFDNNPFLGELERLGFDVVHTATGNYPNTPGSLASSLNMKYLDELAAKVGVESSSLTPIHNSIEDNAVSAFLRTNGYDFYNVGSWWEPTRTNRFATKSFVAEQGGLGLDEFSTNLILKNTPLGKLAARFFPEAYTSHGARFEYQLTAMREVASAPGPTFAFAHFLMPHDPYIYNADCTERSAEVVDASTYQENYLQQLACANTRILDLVKDIQERSDRGAVIILQSDEGPHPILSPRKGSSWLGYPDQTYQEKLRIFSAVAAPDGFSLPEGSTPVNTFRYVFNHYFGTSFEILPNRSYVHEREERPYRYVEVTDKVTFSKD